MELYSSSLITGNDTLRRWFIVGLVVLPVVLTVSGLDAYYDGETWEVVRPHPWREIMGKGFGSFFGPTPKGFYRPLGIAVPALFYNMFGADPILPRAIQTAVYVGTCLLAFLILESLSGSFLAAAIGALIFTVMPGHAEPWFLVVPMNLNATFSSLLCFWLAGPSYRKRPSWVKILIASLALATGLLSYPYTILTIVLLFAYEMVWRTGEGFVRVRLRLIKAHLPLWLISAAYLAIRLHQFSQSTEDSAWYLEGIRTLTIPALAKKVVSLVYGTILPLQLSPVLLIAAAALILTSLKGNWRFPVFMVLWVFIGLAMSYPQKHVVCLRVFLASFGSAGLLGYLLIDSLGGIVDDKKRPRPVLVLDWVFATAIIYWAFELLRMGWLDFFHGTSPGIHLRHYAAPIAALALILRFVLTKSYRPRLSRAPLKFLSLGLILVILLAYTAGFSKLLELFVADADMMARVPKAIVAARASIPDNTYLFISTPDVRESEEGRIAETSHAPLRSEYGKALHVAGFRNWVNATPCKEVPKDASVLVFRIEGDRAVQDAGLANQVLKPTEQTGDRLPPLGLGLPSIAMPAPDSPLLGVAVRFPMSETARCVALP